MEVVASLSPGNEAEQLLHPRRLTRIELLDRPAQVESVFDTFDPS
jgi:hypothetical protein